MGQIWNLDDDCCEVRVFIEPLPGNILLDVGTEAMPIAVTTAITAPVAPRQRSWLVGTGGPATPTLPTSAVGPVIQEWWLAGTDDDNTINLDTTAGLKLSGPWVGGVGSILYLQADGATGWIEGGRNEI